MPASTCRLPVKTPIGPIGPDELEQVLSSMTAALARRVPPWMRHDLPWDIAVEVVMRVGNNPERFPTKACVFAYALEAMPKAAGRYRKRSRREVVFLHAPARICEQPSFAQRDRIRRALDRLPQVLRETYVAVEILGETPEAFAEREGITARTVENRLSLARGRLRAVLAEEDS